MRGKAIDEFLLPFAAVDAFFDECLILLAEFFVLSLESLRLQFPKLLFVLLLGGLVLAGATLTEGTAILHSIRR